MTVIIQWPSLSRPDLLPISNPAEVDGNEVGRLVLSQQEVVWENNGRGASRFDDGLLARRAGRGILSWSSSAPGLAQPMASPSPWSNQPLASLSPWLHSASGLTQPLALPNPWPHPASGFTQPLASPNPGPHTASGLAQSLISPKASWPHSTPATHSQLQ